MVRLISFFLSLLMLTSAAQAHDPKECRALEEAAATYMSNLNKLFGMKLKLEFLTQGGLGLHQKRPATLHDSNANTHGVVKMAKPCQLPENSLPSKELYLMVLGHEFAHHIYDGVNVQQSSCVDIVFDALDTENYEDSLADPGHYASHYNLDILSLKLLNHFNIDQRKAIVDARSYIKSNQEIYDLEEPLIMAFRYKKLDDKIPTDFSRGDDFFQVGFIQHKHHLDHMMNKNGFEQFKKDVNSSYSERAKNCEYIEAGKSKKAARAFKTEYENFQRDQGSFNDWRSRFYSSEQ